MSKWGRFLENFMSFNIYAMLTFMVVTFWVAVFYLAYKLITVGL